MMSIIFLSVSPFSTTIYFLPGSLKVPEILTLSSPLCLSFYVIVARFGHTSVVLSDGSVLVMGGYDRSLTNDVWKTVDGGSIWMLVTSSAGWTGKNILHLSNSLPLLPSLLEDSRLPHSFIVSHVSFAIRPGINILGLTLVIASNQCFLIYDEYHFSRSIRFLRY